MKKGAVAGAVVLVLALVAVLVFGPPGQDQSGSDSPAGPAPGVTEADRTAPATEGVAPPSPATPATPAPSAPPSTPSARPPETASTRIRPMPRKRKMDFKVDLDGDGQPERVVAEQRQASDTWAGGDSPGGPRGEVRVLRGAAGEVALRWEAPGYILGTLGLAARIGGAREVPFVVESRVDDNDQIVHWITVGPGGEVRRGEMKNVPLELWDLAGDGVDAVAVLSQELYLDFIKRGTMDLLAWRGERFESLLPGSFFEICALERDGGAPLLVAGVTREGDALLLLEYSASDKKLEEVQRLAVMPPERGPRWNVPHGFALACSFPGQRPLGLQYRQRRFALGGDGRLVEQTPAPAPPAE